MPKGKGVSFGGAVKSRDGVANAFTSDEKTRADSRRKSAFSWMNTENIGRMGLGPAEETKLEFSHIFEAADRERVGEQEGGGGGGGGAGVKEGKDAEKDAEIRELFDLYDRDKQGWLKKSDLRAALGATLESDEIDALFRKFSKHGKVTFDKFSALMVSTGAWRADDDDP